MQETQLKIDFFSGRCWLNMELLTRSCASSYRLTGLCVYHVNVSSIRQLYVQDSNQLTQLYTIVNVYNDADIFFAPLFLNVCVYKRRLDGSRRARAFTM